MRRAALRNWSVELADPSITVHVREATRARRLTLRLESRGDAAVLTTPPGLPDCEIHGFLGRHSGWLRRALAERPEPVPVDWGAVLPVDGVGRTVLAAAADRNGHLLPSELHLRGGGPCGPRAAAWLKARAHARVVPLAHEFGARLGRQPTGIAFRDTRSRWGSCSAAGRLSFSWRLAMAPPEVQAYVAAHEVAHLAEMNHSPRYWAVLAGLMPEYEAPRDWLRTEGRALHRYRFDTR